MTATMDFPAAWEFVRQTNPLDHHYRCSWRTTDGALLCDCAIIWREYGRREVLGSAADLARWLQDTIESQPAITIRQGVEPQVAWRALADELLRRQRQGGTG